MILSNATGCMVVDGVHRYVKQANCLDDFVISHRNRAMAAKAWYREKECHCNQAYLAEFKEGFLQGYIDVATGADGCVPAIAPSQYWGWRYQSADGQAAVNAWFAGYPLGAKAAEEDGVAHWGQIVTMDRHVPTAADAYQQQPVAPTPAPYMIGPDGQPITEEVIVPGSERIVPDGEALEELDLDQTIESLAPPAGEALQEIIPEASIQPVERPLSQSQNFRSGEIDGSDAGIADYNATRAEMPEGLNRPVLENVVDISQTTSNAGSASANGVELSLSDAGDLPATEKSSIPFGFNDLGDDAIEGIFGAQNRSGLPPGSDAVTETANASGEIPFKFD
ncbi:hypothetical protein FYK55_25975 [Roseiconus nitratireducens]|uniref:Uncharacterized protein n=1 Tax=Roseiconus nitratireducens TaxID=2605748 RepID=A0A5M6CUF1_9BACT|nr:hypothetical protein [Roseiconus nitratireducens]KAA5538888.1 hypothetical protein FYK55_25975 [Roseiconus nitratireducens]